MLLLFEQLNKRVFLLNILNISPPKILRFFSVEGSESAYSVNCLTQHQNLLILRLH